MLSMDVWQAHVLFADVLEVHNSRVTMLQPFPDVLELPPENGLVSGTREFRFSFLFSHSREVQRLPLPASKARSST